MIWERKKTKAVRCGARRRAFRSYCNPQKKTFEDFMKTGPCRRLQKPNCLNGQWANSTNIQCDAACYKTCVVFWNMNSYFFTWCAGSAAVTSSVCLHKIFSSWRIICQASPPPPPRFSFLQFKWNEFRALSMHQRQFAPSFPVEKKNHSTYAKMTKKRAHRILTTAHAMKTMCNRKMVVKLCRMMMSKTAKTDVKLLIFLWCKRKARRLGLLLRSTARCGARRRIALSPTSCLLQESKLCVQEGLMFVTKVLLCLH